jgi:aldose sugar dehydrogenase
MAGSNVEPEVTMSSSRPPGVHLPRCRILPLSLRLRPLPLSFAVLPMLTVLPLLVGCNAAGDRAGGTGPGAQPATPVAHRVVTVVDGLERPWGMAFLPDGGILVTERDGRLRVVRDGVLAAAPIAGVPAVRAEGQGGLLDVALHPDFARNRLVYLSYSKPGPQGATTAVARGRLDGDRLHDVEDVFVASAWAGSGQHFGSRIVFGGDGLMYVSIGERGQQQPAQSLRDHIGTTVRLHDDGRVPQDNPFVGRDDALPEIYTYGHRNVQSMAVHPRTGEVWQAEHGPRGGDELNVLRAGGNYGWPDYNWGNHYDGRPIADPQQGAGTVLPVLHWTPAVAPSGMTIYDGAAFPQWRGDIFIGSLVGEHVRRVRIDERGEAEQERLLADRGQRIRDVRTGPDGLLYVLVDAPRAPLLRIEPAAP